MQPSLKPEEIRALDHFILRVKRRKQLLTLFMFVSLASISGIALLVYKFTNTKTPVLGTTSTTPLPVNNPAVSFCLNAGGIVVDKVGHSFCQLESLSCPLNLFYSTGDCQSPIITSSPTAPVPTPAKRQLVYKIDLVHQSGITPIESSLSSYLYQALNLDPKTTFIENIYYDARFNSPYQEDKFNHTYYLLLIAHNELPQTVYQDYATTITVEPMSADLIPYLLDPNFCTTTADCAVRTNFCQYGAFNHFQIFTDVYACAGYADEFGNNRVVFDEQNQCKANTFYNGATCINSSCLPEGTYTMCLEN
jgi:hypothetical protein